MPRNSECTFDGIIFDGDGVRRYPTIPENLEHSLYQYATKGVPTGGFLQKCLENNLMIAVGSADHRSLEGLKEICMYIYNEVPSPCWGSVEKVHAWLSNDWSEARGHALFPTNEGDLSQGGNDE